MSYITCPNCQEIIYPFGKSRAEKFATSQNVRLLGQLPIQQQLVQAADEGTIDEVALKEMDTIIRDLVFNLDKENE